MFLLAVELALSAILQGLNVDREWGAHARKRLAVGARAAGHATGGDTQMMS